LLPNGEGDRRLRENHDTPQRKDGHDFSRDGDTFVRARCRGSRLRALREARENIGQEKVHQFRIFLSDPVKEFHRIRVPARCRHGCDPGGYLG